MDQNDDKWNHMHDLLTMMSAEAVRELNVMRHPSAGASLKAAAKKVLGRPSGYAASRDAVFWPAGMLLLGLLEAGHDREVRDYLADWMQDGMPVRHPDDALTGEVLLRICEMDAGAEASLTRADHESCEEKNPSEVGGAAPYRKDEPDYKSQYLQGAEQIYDYLKSCRRDEEGTIVYGQESNNNYIFADGVGQTVLFLAHYGRLFHSEEALTEAGRQMSNFLRHGIDERSGLPYHGYDAKTGVCHGIVGWGRAVGWLLFGLTELVRSSRCGGRENAGGQTDSAQDIAQGAGKTAAGQKGEYDLYEQALIRITDACLQRIREDGLFSWQMDCLNGPADTSAAGMILWSLERVMQEQDDENADLGEVLDRGADALMSCVDAAGRVGKASAECIDFGEYRQIYGNYPWGQGAALMFLGAYSRGRW